MRIQNNLSSKLFNTFNIDVNFETVITINDAEELSYLDLEIDTYKVLGGGSNILLKSNLDVPILHIDTKGIQVIKEDKNFVLVEVAAGEIWHDLVMWSIQNNYGGIENLSLIPGRCGAAPMQNIGAYGVEIKDVLHTVKAFHSKSKRQFTFHNQECNFGYRSSNFKTKWKDEFIITHIVLKLTKPGSHELNVSYGAISGVLKNGNISQPTIKDVSDAVIAIRRSKLPDPKEIGNSGSFFKNPIVTKDFYDELLEKVGEVPSYEAGAEKKIPAGWLIDQCGWKGKIVGQTGTYKNQALVLVNHGRASGEEVYNLAKEIQKSVTDKFGITLEPEVNIW